jgi:hypothetical protein
LRVVGQRGQPPIPQRPLAIDECPLLESGQQLQLRDVLAGHVLAKRLSGLLRETDAPDLDLRGVRDLEERERRRDQILTLQRVEHAVPCTNFPLHGAIHVVQCARGVGVEAGVHENRLADLQHDFSCADPAAVLAGRAELLQILDVAGWMSGHPLIANEHGAAALCDRRVSLERLPASILGAAVSEERVGLRRHVSRVVQEIHPFMVAEEDVDASAGAPRFAFEAHQQIHHLAYVLAAISEVSRLHEPG